MICGCQENGGRVVSLCGAHAEWARNEVARRLKETRTSAENAGPTELDKELVEEVKRLRKIVDRLLS